MYARRIYTTTGRRRLTDLPGFGRILSEFHARGGTWFGRWQTHYDYNTY